MPPLRLPHRVSWTIPLQGWTLTCVKFDGSADAWRSAKASALLRGTQNLLRITNPVPPSALVNNWQCLCVHSFTFVHFLQQTLHGVKPKYPELVCVFHSVLVVKSRLHTDVRDQSQTPPRDMPPSMESTTLPGKVPPPP